MTPRVLIVIQARIGSVRRPAKIMASLAGPPMLEHVVRRMQSVGDYLPQFAIDCRVATTDLDEDDLTIALCEQLQVDWSRGSAGDVLSRYLAATADLADGDLIIRATADNPLYCARRTADLIAHHLRRGNDYTYLRDLSHGVPEIMHAATLRGAAHTTDPYCREHVTPYLRKFPGSLQVEELSPTWQGVRPEFRLTVDTPEDVARLNRILKPFANPLTVSLDQAYRVAAMLRLQTPNQGRVVASQPPNAA